MGEWDRKQFHLVRTNLEGIPNCKKCCFDKLFLCPLILDTANFDCALGYFKEKLNKKKNYGRLRCD